MKRILALIATLTLVATSTPVLGAAPETKAKPYPLETCIVSGEKLGEMGEPVVFVHDGREVKLCCKGCRKDFDKDTAKFVAKIDEAAKKVKPYKLETCLVSDEKLEADTAFVFVAKGQEIKLCCKSCKKDFDKNPDKFLKKLAAKK